MTIEEEYKKNQVALWATENYPQIAEFWLYYRVRIMLLILYALHSKPDIYLTKLLQAAKKEKFEPNISNNHSWINFFEWLGVLKSDVLKAQSFHVLEDPHVILEHMNWPAGEEAALYTEAWTNFISKFPPASKHSYILKISALQQLLRFGYKLN
jgi:hypothetical protein